jgi:hypothetical protein
MKMFLRFTLITLVFCLAALPAFAGNAITGRIINATSNQPSAGDQVVLLRLGEGMQEEARTVSDSSGNFALQITEPESPHLIRVIHQGVNYDQKLSAAPSFEMRVFDSVPRIDGLSGQVGMAQIESDGATLKVTEMYDIANVSQPPVTQVGPRNFEFSIASGATLESLQARKGGGVWVNLNPVSVPGSANRYAVDFPIRPGDTLFRFVYRLPASAAVSFQLKPAYPVSRFAVVHPPSMIFKAARAGDFTSPGVTKGLRIEQVVSSSPLHQIPVFEISGVGVAPPADANASTPAAGAAAVSIPVPHSSSSGKPMVKAPEDGGGFWPLVVAFACLFATVLFGSWRRKRQASADSESGKAA